MAYDFSTLSHADFEDLARDLVGRELGVRFECFPEGPDDGMDGRHATAEGTIILQAKHYNRSGFAKLKSKMIKERAAIDRLHPKRYILVTSAPLTPRNKGALAEVIGPSLLGPSDLFGAGELNALLRKHPDVERAHQKLWAGSTAVLETVIKGAVATVFDKPTQDAVQDTFEPRYLEFLVAHLASRRGVREYTPLTASLRSDAPIAQSNDEWGFNVLLPPTVGVPTASQRIDGLESALDRYPRFVLLGQPGSGKTTALRHLAMVLVRRRRAGDASAPLPLYLECSRWRYASSAQEFIRNDLSSLGFASADCAAALRGVENGRIALLLDGLNEMGGVGAANSAAIDGWLRSSAAPANIVVSCRSGEFYGQIRIPSLAQIELLPLSPSQIRDFAEHYLGSRASRFLATLTIDGLEDARSGVAGRQGLRLLAENPYLLSALIILFEASPDEHIPYNVGSLFSRLANAVFEREITRGALDRRAASVLQSNLGALAFAMIDTGAATSVSIATAVTYLRSAEAIQTAANTGLLVESDADQTLRFSHQLFQEHFAALELKKRGVDGFVEPYQLAEDEWNLSVISHKWDEAIVALAGIVDNPSPLIATVARLNPLLAVRCMHGIESLDANLLIQLAAEICIQFEMDSKRLDAEADAWRGRTYRGGSQKWEDMANARDSDLGRLRAYMTNILSDVGTAALPAFVEALGSNNAEVRCLGVQGLGNVGDASHVGSLIARLADKASVRVPGPFMFRAETDFTLPRLSGGSVPISLFAARGLAQIGTPEANAAVHQWLRESVSKSQYTIESTLLRAGAALLPVLVTMLESEPPEIACHLAMPAGAIWVYFADNLPSAQRVKFETHLLLQHMTAIFLARSVRSVSAYDDLLKRYDSGIAIVQEQVMRALGTIGDVRRLDRFSNFGAGKVEETNQASLAIIPKLRSVLMREAGNRVTRAGIQALDAFDSAEAAKVLAEISAADQDPDTRRAAKEALSGYLKRHATHEGVAS